LDAGEVYILHSQNCLDSGIDLRDCTYSESLDRGCDDWYWTGFEDRTVVLEVTEDGYLKPARNLYE
jgi:hypothetical protein